jgi:hypothetical protein
MLAWARFGKYQELHSNGIGIANIITAIAGIAPDPA